MHSVWTGCRWDTRGHCLPQRWLSSDRWQRTQEVHSGVGPVRSAESYFNIIWVVTITLEEGKWQWPHNENRTKSGLLLRIFPVTCHHVFSSIHHGIYWFFCILSHQSNSLCGSLKVTVVMSDHDCSNLSAVALTSWSSVVFSPSSIISCLISDL